MFDISRKTEDGLIIYKTPMLDAATCVIKNDEAQIVKAAKKSIAEMFLNMEECFMSGQMVMLKFLKRKDSDSVSFSSFNQFKVWLIRMQGTEAFRFVLHRLKIYGKKRNIALPAINISFGDHTRDQIYNTNMYFKNSYQDRWLNDEIIQKAVLAIDKSKVINGKTIDSPVFGIMPPDRLSGGVKTLILMYHNPDKVFNASTCGDNCAKWIVKFAKEKDFMITLYHTMLFPERNFKAYIANEDTVVDSFDEYIRLSDKCCRV